MNGTQHANRRVVPHPRMLFYDLSVPKLTYASRDAERFGAILKRLRFSRGWTLVIAAQRCGMNPTYLGALEKGGNMPSVRSLLEIADVYGVSAADIVREVEDQRRAARERLAAAAAAAVKEPE